MITRDLLTHIKNCAGSGGKVIRQLCIISLSLKAVAKHIDTEEVTYNDEYKHDKFVVGIFLERLNWKVHMLLDSCASGEFEKLDLKKLDFADMLESVE